MAMTIQLVSRIVGTSQSVIYTFDNKTSVEYQSVEDAAGNSPITEETATSMLRDVLISIMESTGISAPITAVYDPEFSDGVLVRIIHES